MPININYDPSFGLVGDIAYRSGRGRFLQQEDQFNFDQDRFDQQFGLQERNFEEGQRRFDEQQALSLYAANLRNRQFQQQLGQRSYEHDTGILARQQLQQQQLLGGLQQQQLRQEGLDRYQQGQADLQRQGIEARERTALRGNLARIQQQQQEQLFKAAMSDAAEIQKFKGFRSPEQKQQAVDGWLEQYGDMFGGDFPYHTPIHKPEPMFTHEQAQSQLTGALGPGFGEEEVAGMAAMLGHDEDGEWVWDVEGKDRVKFINDRRNEKRLEREGKLKAEVELEKQQQQEQQSRREASLTGFGEFAAAMAEFQTVEKNDDGVAVNKPKPNPYAFGLPAPISKDEVFDLPVGAFFVMQGVVYRKTSDTGMKKVDESLYTRQK